MVRIAAERATAADVAAIRAALASTRRRSRRLRTSSIATWPSIARSRRSPATRSTRRSPRRCSAGSRHSTPSSCARPAREPHDRRASPHRGAHRRARRRRRGAGDDHAPHASEQALLDDRPRLPAGAQAQGARGAMNDRIVATYWVETAFPLDVAAASMAGEQSSGTFVRVPGQNAELEARASARVVAIEAARRRSTRRRCPARRRRAAAVAPRWRRARVTLDWPLDNLGPSLPTLMATVAGNLFELGAFSGPAPARRRAAAAVLRSLSRPRVRRGRDAATRRRARATADRDHRQALGRPRSRGHRVAGRRALRRRHRLRQGRRTAGRRSALSVRSAGGRGHGGDRPARRPPRPQADVRVQSHGRGRRDAAAARSRARARRHLRDGEPQLGRARRACLALARARGAADPRASQRLGLPVALARARLRLRRLAETAGGSPAQTTCTSTGSPTSSARTTRR